METISKHAAATVMLMATGLLSGCGSEGGEQSAGRGTAKFTTWGEEFIEQGISSDEFADGWAITFDRFLVVLGEITVRHASGELGARLEGTQLFDLHSPGPHLIGTTPELAAKAWEDVSFVVVPAAADTQRHDAATDADLTLMQDGGYSVYVAGTATQGTAAKSFAWGFILATRYGDCQHDAAGAVLHGLVIPSGGVEQVEFTIHGDHLFYDSFGPDAVLRFAAMADADADGDNHVTLEELREVRLANLAEGAWDAGGHNVDYLDAFVTQLTTTLGHYRGEGHCLPSSL